jgi:hypothetical protein
LSSTCFCPNPLNCQRFPAKLTLDVHNIIAFLEAEADGWIHWMTLHVVKIIALFIVDDVLQQFDLSGP